MTGYLQQQDGAASPLWWAASQNFITQNTGLLLVICSQFFFASMTLCVKLLDKLDPPTPALEVSVLANVMTLRSSSLIGGHYSNGKHNT
jgi:hypothetical protein